jgi:hypothetical protein
MTNTALGRVALGFAAVVCAVSAGGTARAAEEPRTARMIEVKSNYPDGYNGKIIAKLNADGTAAGFEFKDSRGTDLNYTVDQLHQGVVLLHALGKDVVGVRSKDFDPKTGGVLEMNFLRRFFSDDRRKVLVDYVHEGEDWVLRTDDAQGRDPFSALNVVVAMSFGVPSGVDTIVLDQDGVVLRRYDSNDLPHVDPVRRRRHPRAF